jgi:hypothetical protein
MPGSSRARPKPINIGVRIVENRANIEKTPGGRRENRSHAARKRHMLTDGNGGTEVTSESKLGRFQLAAACMAGAFSSVFASLGLARLGFGSMVFDPRTAQAQSCPISLPKQLGHVALASGLPFAVWRPRVLSTFGAGRRKPLGRARRHPGCGLQRSGSSANSFTQGSHSCANSPITVCSGTPFCPTDGGSSSGRPFRAAAGCLHSGLRLVHRDAGCARGNVLDLGG